ncbi:hypothetical protein SNE40_012860 [Patella caerulea]|uniref:Nucleolar protein 16 n=1 Tax=Patella caerulea TaxID=87958 RepID=A0AAN8JJJ2_PATCE
MGSTRRQRMRRKYDHNKDRKKAWKNKLKKPAIGCEPMREAWDERKPLKTNLSEMGLSYDPNKTLPFRKPKVEDEQVKSSKQQPTVTKPQVVNALETDANTPRLKSVWTTPEIANFCMTMMDRHGDDYVAMARDPLNIFQHTPKQIRRKIENMKKVPGLYEDYLASRAGGDEQSNS